MEYYDPYNMQGYDPYQGMTEEERITACCLHAAAFVVVFFVALLLCALMGSCTTTKYVPVIEHRTDTVRITRHERDSIYVHDSIHVREAGDTVTVERWHTRWRDRWQHDTTYISKTDSVPAPYPVEVEVPAAISRWQHVRMALGDAVLWGAVIAIFLWLRRRAWP